MLALADVAAPGRIDVLTGVAWLGLSACESGEAVAPEASIEAVATLDSTGEDECEEDGSYECPYNLGEVTGSVCPTGQEYDSETGDCESDLDYEDPDDYEDEMSRLVASRRRLLDTSSRSLAWPRWAHGLAAGMVLTSAAIGCGEEPGVRGAGVRYPGYEWGEAEPLPWRGLLRSPNATVGEPFWFTGRDIPLLDDSVVSPTPLQIMSSRGDTIAGPPGGTWFHHPRLLEKGRYLHLFWGEDDPRPDHAEWIAVAAPETREIWHARYSRDGGWTAPRVMVRGFIHWEAEAPHVRDGSDGYMLPVTIFGDSARDLALLRVQDGQARARWLRVAHFPLHVDLTIGTGDSLFLAWVGPSLRERHPQVVQFAASGDEGKTWSDPEVLGPPDGARARSVAITYAAADSTVRVFWLSQDRGTIVSRARSSGGEWGKTTSLRVGGVLTRPTVIVDSCGRSHIVLEHNPQSEPSLLHFLWHDEAPTQIPLPNSGFRSGGFDLTHSRQSGKIILLWNTILEWPYEAGPGSSQLHYSVLQYHCS